MIRKKIRKALSDLLVEVIHNLRWRSGVASSLQTGAGALATQHNSVLMLGIDQPRLQKEHLNNLLRSGVENSQRAIVGGYEGPIGIPVFVPMTILQRARELSGDTGLKRILSMETAVPIVLAAPEWAFGVDTPRGLAEAVRQGWLDA